jgi:uncharacterized protein (TIGR02300 family)
MRKATQKSSPVSLGTKRSCPDCGTKFYDFNKDEVVCPKCETKFDPHSAAANRGGEPKKVKPVKEVPEEALMESEDIVVEGSEESFESVEDLEDEDDDLVEDMGADDEEDNY